MYKGQLVTRTTSKLPHEMEECIYSYIILYISLRAKTDGNKWTIRLVGSNVRCMSQQFQYHLRQSQPIKIQENLPSAPCSVCEELDLLNPLKWMYIYLFIYVFKCDINWIEVHPAVFTVWFMLVLLCCKN